MERNIENELRNLVEAEYENLEGISKEDFFSWAIGLFDGLVHVDNLTRNISDKVYESIF